MKQFVGGLFYDTDKANEIAHYQFTHSTNGDINESFLYQTENGNWFAHNVTTNADFPGRNSANIEPLDEEGAMEWANQHNTGFEELCQEMGIVDA